MSIKPLPGDVVAQIKSSVVITSLGNVICGLLKNALDAEASKVSISLDFARGNCSVEDNGIGIAPSEFRETGGLGQLYYTSKYPHRSGVHGKHGTFLASVASLSLFSVASHHREYHSHNSLSIHNSRVLARHTPALPEQQVLTFSHGTRVTVRDLFGSMPVRVKHRALQAERSSFTRDWDHLILSIVALLLAWPGSTSVSIRETSSRQSLFFKSGSRGRGWISDSCRMLHQASLYDNADADDWVPIGASMPALSINGYVCIVPVATKRAQFISHGIEPLTNELRCNILYEEINKVFSNSSFGAIEDNNDDEPAGKAARTEGFTNKELKIKKGVDRWPMFMLRISLRPTSGEKSPDADDIFDDRWQSLAVIVDLLRAMFHEFLKKRHCRPKTVRLSTNPESCRRKTVPKTKMANEDVSVTSSVTVRGRRRDSSTQGTYDPSSETAKEGSSRVASPAQKSGSRHESPFDSWSRIKAGRTLNTFKESSNSAATPSSVRDTKIRQKTITPVSNITLPKSGSSDSPKTTLYDASGKLTRKPFEEVDASKLSSLRSLRSRISTHDPDTSEASSESQEESFMWTNPVTKIASIVDARTGFVKTAKPAKMTKRISAVAKQEEGTNATTETAGEVTWVKDLVSKWKNPVFESIEPPVPRLSGALDSLGIASNPTGDHCSGHQTLDFGTPYEQPTIGVCGRLTKSTLGKAQLISQVYNRFILMKVSFDGVMPEQSSDQLQGNDHKESSLLVLVDQHAADERCRVEALMRGYFEPSHNPDGSRVWKACTERLPKAIHFELSSQEGTLLRSFRAHFEHWGIHYELTPSTGSTSKPPKRSDTRVAVQSLPPSILERCRAEPRLLAELIRKEAWRLKDESALGNQYLEQQGLDCGDDGVAWVSRFHGCPPGILDLINSRSCRSAIMFNDPLTMEQCTELFDKLVQCAFPFQCAHGRPSMVPLVDMGDGLVGLGSRPAEELRSEEPFLQKLKKWKPTL